MISVKSRLYLHVSPFAASFLFTLTSVICVREDRRSRCTLWGNGGSHKRYKTSEGICSENRNVCSNKMIYSNKTGQSALINSSPGERTVPLRCTPAILIHYVCKVHHQESVSFNSTFFFLQRMLLFRGIKPLSGSVSRRRNALCYLRLVRPPARPTRPGSHPGGGERGGGSSAHSLAHRTHMDSPLALHGFSVGARR